MPRWATTLHLVIPTGAQRRDLQFPLMEKRNPEATRPRHIRLYPIVKLQVPLHYAPVGMTNWRAVAHLGTSGHGWTELTNEGPRTYNQPFLRNSISNLRVLTQTLFIPGL